MLEVITEDQYFELLGCLPPYKTFYNAFIVGEPFSHTKTGREIWICCFIVNKEHFRILSTESNFKRFLNSLDV